MNRINDVIKTTAANNTQKSRAVINARRSFRPTIADLEWLTEAFKANAKALDQMDHGILYEIQYDLREFSFMEKKTLTCPRTVLGLRQLAALGLVTQKGITLMTYATEPRPPHGIHLNRELRIIFDPRLDSYEAYMFKIRSVTPATMGNIPEYLTWNEYRDNVMVRLSLLLKGNSEKF